MATESASAIGHASSWGYACFLTVSHLGMGRHLPVSSP